MPKFTLLLGRKTIQTYDIPGNRVSVGRDESNEIIIDNASVSRHHAVFKEQPDGSWLVEDLGSSNGTFFHGEKLGGPQAVKYGDEVGFGKFSIVFGKHVAGEAVPAHASPAKSVTPDYGGTMQIQTHEVKELLKDGERQRRAHLLWESGGQKGTHYLTDQDSVVVGTDSLCDVKVPSGPKHELLIISTGKAVEARNLGGGFFAPKMKVSGRDTNRAALRDGDVVEMKGVKVTFVGDVK